MENSYLFIKDILTFIFSLVGLIIAGIGLSTWRKQLKGGKEFDIGYNLNYTVLKMREAIKFVRNPYIWNNEADDAEKDFAKKYPQSSVDDQKKGARAHVYALRWKRISEAMTEMESHLLGAEILWGKEVLTKIKPMNDSIKKLNISLYRYFNPHISSKTDDDDIIYNSGTDENPDEFSKEVEKGVETINSFIKSKKVI